MLKPKRSTARQLSGSKYLDNLEKEADASLATKNAKKKRRNAVPLPANTSDDNNRPPSRNST